MSYIEDNDVDLNMDLVGSEEVDRYRNWPIYKGIGTWLYVIISGNKIDCINIKDAHKEIDKSIKKWNKLR